jgi:hypothetical protein
MHICKNWILPITLERRIDMKKYIVLSLMLIITCVLFGQEKPVENYVPKPPPAWLKEELEWAESNYVETFADAFKDPNVFIGVFERPEPSTKSVTVTTLSSGEILEELPEYWQAMARCGPMLRCVKSIKGKFAEPVVFVICPPLMRRLAGPLPLPFIPFFGSRWVLALKKTSKEYRIERFGKDIEEYKFFNDRTVFSLFRGGHGALCLKWPDEDKRWTKPEYLVKVPDSIVDDLEVIQRAMPYVLKEKNDPNEIAALTNTSKALKTDVAKSIFAKVLSGKYSKVQDPNSG